jgi:UDP-2,3-diacylglucosamine hydrolase
VDKDAEILFVSDLHLDQKQPEITKNFVNFLKARASQARALYILGDLFEVWLGDDDESESFSEVFENLKTFSSHAQLYFIHGNRDFLVGQQLADKLGITLLTEPQLIQLGDQKVALMHGDLLCTDDVDYQNFRNLVRQPAWQQQFLAKPLSERQQIAAALRQESAQAMNQKTSLIMDVNQTTVENLFDELGIDILIHGHTHRPAVHQHGQTRQRFVLGDWRPEASYISWKNNGLTLHDPRFNQSEGK